MKSKEASDPCWPALSYPLSLTTTLSAMTKEELKTLQRRLGVVGKFSQLNKSELVLKLAELMPDQMVAAARNWDEPRWKLVQKLVRGEGLASKPQSNFMLYDYFRNLGMIIPATVEGKQVLLMPTELLAKFKGRSDLFSIPKMIKRNTEWIQLARGLLFYYGALEEDELESLIYSYTGQPEDEESDLLEVLVESMMGDDGIDVDIDGVFTHVEAIDPKRILREHAMRSQVGFYPFTRAQLLEAAVPEFIDRNKFFDELVRYLIREFEADKEEAELVVELCVDACKNGDSLGDIIGLLQESIEVEDMRTLSELTDLLVPLMNNTRQWFLKGYSPTELSATRGRSAVVQPTNVLTLPPRPRQAEVISMTTKQKIGRNDPCPCGSGKKFKKCCSD